MTVSFAEMFTPAHPADIQATSTAAGIESLQADIGVGESRLGLTPAQKEAAIRRCLALIAELESRAKHARTLLAQLKGET